jgi:hypothetical protein
MSSPRIAFRARDVAFPEHEDRTTARAIAPKAKAVRRDLMRASSIANVEPLW